MTVPASAIYYYPFDTTGSSTVTNSGSATHSMTLTGAVVGAAPGGGVAAFLYYPTSRILAGGSTTGLPLFTGDCTIEGWVYFVADESANETTFGLSNFLVGRAYNGMPRLFTEGTPFDGTSALPVSTWVHLAASRASGVSRLFVNGVQVASTTGYSIIDTDSTGPVIGDTYNTSANCYVDDFIVSNVARYTANFTPAARGSAFSSGGGTTPTLTSDITLAAITSTGTLEASFGFTGASTLANVTSTGTMTASSPVYLTAGTAVLDSVVSDGSFGLLDPVSLVGASTLAAITSSGTLSAVSVPTMQITAVMPSPVVSMRSGAAVTAEMPSPVAQVVMSQPPVMSITASMPYTASAHGGATVRAVQGYTASMAMTAPAIMRVEASIRYEASLTAHVTERMGIVASLPMPVVSMHGGAQVVASMPMPVVSAAMTASATMQVVASMPKPVASLAATMSAVMQITAAMPAPVPLASARIVAVMPGYTARAELSHAFTPAYEAYVLNLNQPLGGNQDNNFVASVPQMTRYTDWPFVQVARVAGEHYAVGPSGIYRLGGTTNDGDPIDWSFETCMTDFGDPHRKTVASAYLSGQCPAELTYTLRSGDDTDRLYDHITTRTTQKRNHRQKFGLGRRVRYYSFGLAGQGELSMDGLEFEVIGTTRRV